MLHFHVISLFPELVEHYCNHSILKRAQDNKKIKLHFYDPRDFTKDKWKRVDDKPFGGGPGMVLQAEPYVQAVQKALGRKDKKNIEIIFFSPSGKKWTDKEAKKLSSKKHIILIAGRYEGIDARVQKIFKAKEYSIGDYTLTGGEVPAMVLIDTISRQKEGVLGNKESLEDLREASPEVYTRPREFIFKGKKYSVPKVLLEGNHKEIEKWRKKQKEKRKN